MITVTELLSDDHHRCDALLAEAEGAVAQNDWEAAGRLLREFTEALETHLRMEETVLFPRLLSATGGGATGPVGVMRREHDQMRQVLRSILAELPARSADACLGEVETLFLLMQQHNAKEEQILYPMADRALMGEREALVAEMEAVREAESAGGTPA